MAHLPATLQIWFREPKQNNKSALIRWNVPRVKKTRKLEVRQAAAQVNKTILKPQYNCFVLRFLGLVNLQAAPLRKLNLNQVLK